MRSKRAISRDSPHVFPIEHETVVVALGGDGPQLLREVFDSPQGILDRLRAIRHGASGAYTAKLADAGCGLS